MTVQEKRDKDCFFAVFTVMAERVSRMEKNTVYRWENTVATYDVDQEGKLKMSAILKYNQEAGEQHISMQGFPAATMRADFGLAFVVSAIAVRVYRRPSVGEKITVETWCEPIKKGYYTRNHRYVARGEVLIECKGQYPLVDTNTGRVTRPLEQLGGKDLLFDERVNDSCEIQKLQPFDQGTQIDRRIFYTDIDYNGHLNNTRYADLVLDSLPQDKMNNEIKEFHIKYKEAAFLNDNITICINNKGDCVECCGKREDRVCFIARCCF